MSRAVRVVHRFGSFVVVVAVGWVVVGCAAGGTSAVGASAQPEDSVAASTPGSVTSVAASEGDSLGGDMPFTAWGCGDLVDGLPVVDGLRVTGDFPAQVAGDGEGLFAGVVTVSSTGPSIGGVTAPEADVYLLRSGQVVATSLPQDLIGQPVTIAPGSDVSFPARGAARGCAGDLDGGGPLPAGPYEAVALLVVGQDDGSVITVVGGPWPIEVI